jgi:pyruvate/2-oxoglutarate/acetoin dehydrogenase E1 component
LQVHVLAQAAQAVADADGISCEVLDLRSLMPWDVQVRLTCL